MSILVVHPGSLGDLLLLTGAIRFLRQHFHGHRITVAVRHEYLGFVESFPWVDDGVSIPTNWHQTDWKARIRRWWSRRAVYFRSFTYVMHAPYKTEAVGHDMCRAVRSGHKFWYDVPSSPDRAIYNVLVKVDVRAHELEKYAAMLERICMGARVEPEAVRPDLCLSASEKETARKKVVRIKERQANALVLALCPGARFKQKDWGIDNFIEFLRRVNIHRPLCVFLVGGSDDCERHERIRKGLSGREGLVIEDLAGKITPRESAALIGECDLCVGNDTFGLHAAIAVRTPSVVIMGGGDYPQWIPWGEPDRHQMVVHEMDCFGCGWDCRYGDYRCVRGIGVAEVMEKVNNIGT